MQSNRQPMGSHVFNCRVLEQNQWLFFAIVHFLLRDNRLISDEVFCSALFSGHWGVAN